MEEIKNEDIGKVVEKELTGQDAEFQFERELERGRLLSVMQKTLGMNATPLESVQFLLGEIATLTVHFRHVLAVFGTLVQTVDDEKNPTQENDPPPKAA